MKSFLSYLTIIAGTSMLVFGRSEPLGGSAGPAVAALSQSGPRIEFSSTTFDFGRVSAGEVVKHAFVFTNTGSATLEISSVRPGCGCTTAGAWDKRVEPGKTGSIPLQFNSANFGGKVAKSATVQCNDASHSTVVLQITGTVWKPIEVTPTMAVFNISDDAQTNQTKIVRIINNLEEPLTLSEVQCTNHSFQTELKTVRPGKEFELLVTAAPPFEGRTIMAPVTVKTSSSQMPVISVTAYVTVQQAVMITPSQITLPAGPLASAMQQGVTIRNNGTNSLELSEASINVPNAEVAIRPIQPGRMFSLSVHFPAGFQAQPNQPIEVSVKSNHPKFALIKIPVFQTQRLSAAAAPTARRISGSILPRNNLTPPASTSVK